MVVIANLDLWAKAGEIQLVVNRIELVNKLGVLEEQKKQLIASLQNEGVFDQKNAIASNPKTYCYHYWNWFCRPC